MHGKCGALHDFAYIMSIIFQKIFLVSVKNEEPGYTGDGYYSQALISVFCAVSLWISPSVCNVLGSKPTMFTGALCLV
jgi:Ion channel regulatory protein UNC-93.